MQGFSNLLRQRLGTSALPQVHPEADELTAFIEQCLPRAERERLLQHLSACGHCREVVFLSQPEIPEIQVVGTLPKRSFFALPGFRWVATAAAVAVAAGVAIERPWQMAPHSDLRSSQVAVNSSQEPHQAAVQPPPPSAIVGTIAAPAPAASGQADTVHSVTAEASQTRGVPSYSRPTMAGQGNLVATYSGSGDGPGRTEVVPLQTRGSSVLAQSENYVNISDRYAYVPGLIEAQSISSLPAAPTVKGTDIEQVFIRSTAPPITFEAVQKSASSSSIPDTASVFYRVPTRTRESSRLKDFIHFVGGVDRIASKRAPEGASSFMESSARRSSQPGVHWRIAEGKLLKSTDEAQWREAYPEQDQLNIQFRALATATEGHEVWAGGSHLTLVHSWNGGVNWQTFNLGNPTDGDITKISIDGENLEVQGSNNQTWVSPDGGQKWTQVKQPN